MKVSVEGDELFGGNDNYSLMHEDIKRRDLPRAALLARKFGIPSLVSMLVLVPRKSMTSAATKLDSNLKNLHPMFVELRNPRQMMHVESTIRRRWSEADCFLLVLVTESTDRESVGGLAGRGD